MIASNLCGFVVMIESEVDGLELNVGISGGGEIGGNWKDVVCFKPVCYRR